MDFFTRLTDMGNLKEISRVMILPLLSAAYIQQTGFQLEFSDYILFINGFESVILLVLTWLAIFLGKVFWVWLWFYLLKYIIDWLHIRTNEIVFPVLASLLLTAGILGLTSSFTEPAVFIDIKDTWFFTAIVMAFYFFSEANEIEKLMK